MCLHELELGFCLAEQATFQGVCVFEIPVHIHTPSSLFELETKGLTLCELSPLAASSGHQTSNFLSANHGHTFIASSGS